MADGTIVVRYGARANEREGQGWLPCVTVNGASRCDPWRWRGYDRDEAEARAEQIAREEASRFVGDWQITIERMAP